MTAVLSYLRQAGEARGHAEGEHQQRLQQLGCAVDAGVEIHLWTEIHALTCRRGTGRHMEATGGDVIKRCNKALQHKFDLNSGKISSLEQWSQTDPVKGRCGCRFSFQPSKNTPDPTNQLCKDNSVDWISRVRCV